MGTQLTLTFGLLFVFWLVVYLASKNGSKAAQLEALKSEIKKRAEEQARAQKILHNVADRPVDDVRRRLQDLSGK